MKKNTTNWTMHLYLIAGLGLLIWFFINSLKVIDLKWFDYSWFVLALVFFNVYLYKRQRKYMVYRQEA